MTNDERFDRLATAIERVADAQLATQTQMGFFADQILRLSQQQSAMQQQQTAILECQAKQNQRFDILLGEIRHIVQRLDERP